MVQWNGGDIWENCTTQFF